MALRKLLGITIAVATAAVFGLSAPAMASGFSPGAPGLGDSYFPLEGNGGYRPLHYDLNLSYDPAHRNLSGVMTLTAVATQNLSGFDLDLQGLNVRSVSVDAIPASFSRDGQELKIKPRFGLPRSAPFLVSVRYDGSPKTIVDSPIVFGAPYGWIYTDDGAFVGCEPNAASTWYPSDDHPSMKATFTYRITVPAALSVVANGDLQSTRKHGANTTFTWNETSPMATYLATIDIGKWQFRSGRTPGGIPETMAVDPTLATKAAGIYDLTGQVTDYWSKMFGPYAFSSTGAIVDNVPDIGFSLETQTRPLYGFAAGAGTVSHELAHQWFGDSVSVDSWQHIWLNEGFASFAAWLWTEHTGGLTTAKSALAAYNRYPANSAFWNQSIADPQRDTMFSGAVYTRGAMTLAALRQRVGDDAFFQILRTWTATHRYRTGTTAQFTDLSAKVSGQDLTSFFQTWLWDKTKPPTFG
jgi:aminopeptidase N